MNHINASAINKILMIKSHSAGIGDLIRSSAAWAALSAQFPNAKLDLLFLTKNPGSASEALIADHHLLNAVEFISTREHQDSQPTGKLQHLANYKRSIEAFAKASNPDLIIDFEASGVRSSIAAVWSAKAALAPSLGIRSFPLRSLFYDEVSCSPDEYAKLNKVQLPLNYVDRDFVVLSQLGIHRRGRPIEMKVTEQGEAYQSKLKARLDAAQLVLGLNIGCGTPGAGHKRPDLFQLASCWAKLTADQPFVGLLTGAPDESQLNEEFVAIYKSNFDANAQWINLAGDCNISEFTGLIASCNLFVSTDSGPYHMAVALKIPTLAWFVENNEEHFHYDAWCQCLVNPDPDAFARHAKRLLALN